ncbi:MAG: transposase [Kiritimatiellae bacterium]|nr:transposase [Kiritimatiellia bacterium]
MRHRPPRLSQVFACARPFYLVTFNTHARRPMLACAPVHEAFQGFCAKAADYDVAVGRYVIMPDHTHLFVAMPAEGIILARWVQSLRSNMGKRLLALGHSKPHWQEGFFDHLLRSGENYSEKWEYVAQNPVRAGLADRAEDWPYQGEIERIAF